MNKTTVNRLQNLTLAVLAVSAAATMLRMPLISGGWTGRIQNFLTSHPTDGGEQEAANLTGLISAVHFSSASEPEYGRFHQLYTDVESILFLETIPFFREALGSASPPVRTTEAALQDALNTPNLYIDLTVTLPLPVLAAWLGETPPEGWEENLSFRAIALTTEAVSSTLFLLTEENHVYCCTTALPHEAVQQAAEKYDPNGGQFAYESHYGTLSPYTLLVSAMRPLPQLFSTLPNGYTAHNLLKALDFNTYTNFRYQESNGVEVVIESPGTLRISPNGLTVFSAGADGTSSFFTVDCAGETPAAAEAVLAAARLAQALSSETGSSTLTFSGLSSTETGWEVSFQYRSNGLPVWLPDGKPALSVTIDGCQITAFSYRCRTYSPMTAQTVLLPPDMALAIASLYPRAILTVGYMDTGREELNAGWLALSPDA